MLHRDPSTKMTNTSDTDFWLRDFGLDYYGSNASHLSNLADINRSNIFETLEPFLPDTGNGSNNQYYGYNNSYSEIDISIEKFYYYLFTFAAPSIFVLILIVGMVGNSLVVYVILSRRGMRSATNLLLLNLAVADILFLTITVPFTAYKYAAFSWDFGDIACKVVQYVVYVSAYVTIYTLVAIAFLRFLTVVCSNQTSKYRTKENVYKVAFMIWVIVLAVNVPTLLAHKLKTIGTYSYCGMEKKSVGPIFFTFFTFAYVLPLLIICLLYIGIMTYLHSHNPNSLGSASSRGRTARACKVIILVVVVFGISWLPLHVNSIVAYYGKIPETHYYEIFRVLWNCMAYGNSCANPIIYSYASKEFRKNFRQVICCCIIRWNRTPFSTRNGLTERAGPSETTSMV